MFSLKTSHKNIILFNKLNIYSQIKKIKTEIKNRI
jgi:hypothetical protein